MRRNSKKRKTVEQKQEFRTYEENEWKAEGIRLFGEDRFSWKFQCPICRHVQTPEDFRKYKDNGATPSSAYNECIGRYEGGFSAFPIDGKNKQKPGQEKCDYASYGLFRIGDTVNRTDGKPIVVFPFYKENENEVQNASEGH